MSRLPFLVGLAAVLLPTAACGPPPERSGAETGKQEAVRGATLDEQRSRDEIDYHARERPERLRSGCDRPAGAPRVCVRLAGPRAVPRGSGLRYRVEWRDLPRSGLIVQLERAAPIGERWRYAGLWGPIQLATIPVGGSGARDFEWNGREIGCAPADYPTWCDGVEIGAYTLTAVIVDPPDYSFLGWPDRRLHRTLAWAASPEFSIEGAFDMQSVFYWDRSALHRYIDRQLGERAPKPGERYPPQPLIARRTLLSGYCADIVLDPPLRGTIRACIPPRLVDRFGVRARADDISLSGAVGYRKGLIAKDRAEAVARRIAMRGYERAADHIGFPDVDEVRARYGREAAGRRTWLETEVPDPTYRTEAGGYWLFLVEQRVKTIAGQLAGLRHGLLIKVEPDGTACLIDKGDAATFRPNISADGAPSGLPADLARRFHDPERWSRPCPR